MKRLFFMLLGILASLILPVVIQHLIMAIREPYDLFQPVRCDGGIKG